MAIKETKKVSLVLGGGGARGLVHIGIIRQLEDLGYEIDEVVGCSIGALIGGIYAQGKLDALEEWMRHLTRKSVFNLMDFSWKGPGMMKGVKVFNALREAIPDTAIETLPIPFRAIATDINYEKEVVLDYGSLYDAIRASISIPAFFKAVESDSTILVDGGVLNPLPINHVTKPENLIVAVNLEGMPDEKFNNLKKLELTKSSSLDVLMISYYAMRRKLSSVLIDLGKPDVTINIPYNICGLWDYNRADFLIEEGRKYLDEALKSRL